ncbi:MAG: T9SS type A sorting domain-containing protein [Ekhidna sp.]
MKYIYLTFFLLCTASSQIGILPEYILNFEDDLSEEIGIENRQGRLEYEQLITADPSTGSIPRDIRALELKYANLVESKTKKLRTQSLDIAGNGPFNVGGRTRAVAFDVRNEDIIIAGGVSGGIWKSIDGGISWTRKSDPENRNSVTCLVQDKRPGKQDIWYHGTGELVGNSAAVGGAPFRGNGIYKSIDNGESWNLLPSTTNTQPNVFNSQFQYIWGMVVNEQNLEEDEVLVAAFGGILKSNDGGESWEVAIGQKLFDLDSAVDLNDVKASFYTDIDQGPTGTLIATLSKFSRNGNSPDGGIYLSPDGNDWYDVNPFTDESNFRRVEIGVIPSNPFAVYFLVDPAFILKFNLQSFGPSGAAGFFEFEKIIPRFESSDLGNYNSQDSYNMMIKVHPTDEDIVFVGGTNLYRSLDGFDTSENSKWIGGYTPEGGSGSYPDHHPDQHDLLFYPSNPNKVLSANDGGLMVSDAITADSVRWRSLNNGFVTTQFFTIAQTKEANDPIMIGGLQDNGTDLTSSSSSTSNWEGIIGGDGAYAATTRGKALWYSSFQRGQTFRLTLNDDFDLTTFARIDPGNLVAEEGSEYLFVNPFVLGSVNQNRMFIAGGRHLYYNANVAQIKGGSQEPSSQGWERVTQDKETLYQGGVSAVSISEDGKKVYFGTGGGQVVRIDNANDFNSFDINLTNINTLSFGGFVSCVAVDPQDSEHILVIISSYNVPSIFESFNGGVSYTDVSGNLEENEDGSGSGPSVRWGEIIPTNSGYLFAVGTSTGLYTTELLDGTETTWTRQSNDLIGSAVIPMLDYRSSDGKLAIATHGNGVFTTIIPDFKNLDTDIESEDFISTSVYPNPFQETTTIDFSIPEDGIVRIDIFSIKGEHITNLLWAPQFAGPNSPVTWDGRTNSGASLANGIYLYKIQYNGQSKTGRILLKR